MLRCDVCGGKGKVVKAKCPHCKGTKVVIGQKTVFYLSCLLFNVSLPFDWTQVLRTSIKLYESCIFCKNYYRRWNPKVTNRQI